MRSGARALLWPAVASALAFALLVSLGVWQLRRLGEKEALIARIERRVTLAPADYPPTGDYLLTDDREFAPIRAKGHFLPGRDALIFMKPPEGQGREPGYMVVTPFALSDGSVLLVERGFAPASKVGDIAGRAPPTGELSLVGLIRAPQSRNMFTPADDPARLIWYTRDPASIAAALGLAKALNFTLALQAPSTAGSNGFPVLAPAVPEFANNHLSYALTWFSLAAALLAVFALYARGRLVRDA
jgi:surfeit locus 1 family protein